MTSIAGTSAAARPRQVNPAVLWALLGLGFFAFEACVLGQWITGPNFRPAPVDVASVPALTRQVIHITQWLSPMVVLFIVLKFLLLPWWRRGHMTTDGMLVLAYLGLWFQDPMGNLISTQLYYSAYWVNMGSWTLGSMPGWISPAGHHLPEPILVMGFGYLWLGFSTAWLVCRAMQAMQARWPRASALELMLLALAIGVALDTSAEVALAAAGTFAWPAVIEGLTLFYGQPYQFPMTEGVLFGATIASGGVLRFFKDDHGDTFVERGVGRLRLPPGGATALSFFAIFGFMQLFMALVYSIPMAWLSMYATVNQRYPGHLENGMCVVGAMRDECPRPGLAMPRPPYAGQ